MSKPVILTTNWTHVFDIHCYKQPDPYQAFEGGTAEANGP
jgi:hypothetical protein